MLCGCFLLRGVAGQLPVQCCVGHHYELLLVQRHPLFLDGVPVVDGRAVACIVGYFSVGTGGGHCVCGVGCAVVVDVYAIQTHHRRFDATN